jgi:hypothetical protein
MKSVSHNHRGNRFMPKSKLSPPPIRDLQVHWVPIDTIRPYANNARRHPESQLRMIMRSIKEFGFTNPLLIDGTGMILCGHGRYEAAVRLGFTEVPTIRLLEMTEAQRRAYILADNAIAEKSGWSKAMKATELRGLIDLGYDVELTGFTTLEVDSVLSYDSDGSDAKTTDNEMVELPDESPPVAQLGDHIVFAGKHHLLCADARFDPSYAELLGALRAQMVFTDPPYGTRGSRISSKHGDFVMGSAGQPDAEFALDLIRPSFRNVARYSEPGAIAFVCSDWRAYPFMLDAAAGVFHEQKNLVIFAKSNAGMGSFYRSQTELIPVFKVTRGPTINNFQLGQGGRHRSNLWTYAGANTFRRGRMDDLNDHPTVKPRKLVADAILDCSRPGGVILDPFLGSGTTLAAAHTTGRLGYGLELDPKYCDVIVRRMEALTGEPARMIDGTPFADIARERSATRDGKA